MADEIDRAQELNEQMQAAAERLARQRARRSSLEPCGACYYCDAELPPGRTFCDAECRDAWQNETAARRRNHGGYGGTA